jgi:hypothetical protein
VLHSFQKDKIPGPNGWHVEFYIVFYDTLGNYFLRVIEESKLAGIIHPSFNSTFLSLIPKVDEPSSFDNFSPISLSNCFYKIISKVISKRIKKVFSEQIFREQFGFLDGHQIHEPIGVAREGIHNMKTRKMKGVVLKIDLSKAYERVDWSYLLLTHVSFDMPFIRWVMDCITFVSFAVLINGEASPFFHSK